MGAAPMCCSRADLACPPVRERRLRVVQGFVPAQRSVFKRLKIPVLCPRVGLSAARCQTGSFPLHVCVPARFAGMRPEIVAHCYMGAVLGAAKLADMDMDAAAAIVRDEQAKTGGGQVGWIEATK